MRYVVYTMVVEDGKAENWYYGCYETADRAVEVVGMLTEMTGISGVYYMIAPENDVRAGYIHVNNTPWE